MGGGLSIWLINRSGKEDNLTPQVRTALNTYARGAIENGALPYEMPDKGSLACAVRVFGTDPPSVTAAASATTVYAWIMCATVGTEVQTSFLLPAAIHRTDPPTGQEPIDGAGNERDKHRIFPRRLWGPADDDGDSRSMEALLQQRISQKA
jgi:hypothetical protein